MLNIPDDALFIIMAELFKVDQVKAILFAGRYKRAYDILQQMMHDRFTYPQDNPVKLNRITKPETIKKTLILYPKLQLKVYYSNTNISDVSMLSDVYDLDLSYCHNVKDVSSLRNVHILNLSHCPKITSVSALGKVHTLDLNHCDGISDVSALGNVHTLNLSWCQRVRNVSALGNVDTLNISCCPLITDISMLGNVPHLTTIC